MKTTGYSKNKMGSTTSQLRTGQFLWTLKVGPYAPKMTQKWPKTVKNSQKRAFFGFYKMKKLIASCGIPDDSVGWVGDRVSSRFRKLDWIKLRNATCPPCFCDVISHSVRHVLISTKAEIYTDISSVSMTKGGTIASDQQARKWLNSCETLYLVKHFLVYT